MFYHAATRIPDVGDGCIGQGVGIVAGPVVGSAPGQLTRCRIYTNGHNLWRFKVTFLLVHLDPTADSIAGDHRR